MTKEGPLDIKSTVRQDEIKIGHYADSKRIQATKHHSDKSRPLRRYQALEFLHMTWSILNLTRYIQILRHIVDNHDSR